MTPQEIKARHMGGLKAARTKRGQPRAASLMQRLKSLKVRKSAGL